jgi:flagellar biosynthesis chaperone FliJ
MGLDQIRNLEELSKKAADKSQAAVEQERRNLRVLEQQSEELGKMNRDYQQSVIGSDRITPQLLAHRRAFVTKLTVRLDDLSQQREAKRQTLNQRMTEHRRKNAQHAAIESVCKRQGAEHELNTQRSEQQQTEDAQRGLQHQQRVNKEQDHE